MKCFSKSHLDTASDVSSPLWGEDKGEGLRGFDLMRPYGQNECETPHPNPLPTRSSRREGENRGGVRMRRLLTGTMQKQKTTKKTEPENLTDVHPAMPVSIVSKTF